MGKLFPHSVIIDLSSKLSWLRAKPHCAHDLRRPGRLGLDPPRGAVEKS